MRSRKRFFLRRPRSLVAIRRAASLLAFGVLAILGGCSSNSSSASATDSRVLGITANPISASQQDAANAANLALSAGARGSVLTFSWSQLETSPNVYSLSKLNNSVAFSASQNFSIYFGIQLINTVAREVPSDLATLAWNDAQMEARFHSLLDAIKPSLNSHVLYISIGNEVDVYLATHPAEWSTYQAFYEDAISYIHRTLPGIQVGVTSPFTGASGAQRTNVTQLNTMSDIWVFTYYPIGSGFVPNGPQAPVSDFSTMHTLAGSRPVVLQEVGYPTSSTISSSEADQATFVTNVFKAWQTAGQQTPFLNYFLLHDLTPSTCSTLGQFYGGPNDPAFEAYLCTLGLRTSTDAPKAAWQTLVNSAAAQGFPH
jgi:hypothetical protein